MGDGCGASCAMHSSPMSLLALQEATVVREAGIPPSCRISVRLIDRVDLQIRSGDCLVVRHDTPATAEILVGLLAQPRSHSSSLVIHGVRRAAPALRVRRASIPAGVVSSLVDGWGAEAPPSISTTASPLQRPVLHVLRATRPMASVASGGRDQLEAWRAWGASRRAEGGAVVVVVDTTTDDHGAAAPIRAPTTDGSADARWTSASHRSTRGWPAP